MVYDFEQSQPDVSLAVFTPDQAGNGFGRMRCCLRYNEEHSLDHAVLVLHVIVSVYWCWSEAEKIAHSQEAKL